MQFGNMIPVDLSAEKRKLFEDLPAIWSLPTIEVLKRGKPNDCFMLQNSKTGKRWSNVVVIKCNLINTSIYNLITPNGVIEDVTLPLPSSYNIAYLIGSQYPGDGSHIRTEIYRTK